MDALGHRLKIVDVPEQRRVAAMRDPVIGHR